MAAKKLNYQLGLPRKPDVTRPDELRISIERVTEAVTRMNGEHDPCDRVITACEFRDAIALLEVGTGGASEPAPTTVLGAGHTSAWARVAADGTVLAGAGCTVSRVSEGLYTVTMDTAIDLVGGEVQAAITVSPSATAGNGGQGLGTLREYSSFVATQTGPSISGSAAGQQMYYYPGTNDLLVLDDSSRTVWRHDLDNFAAAATEITIDGAVMRSPIYTGSMDYEKEHLWFAGDTPSGGSSVRRLKLSDSTVTNYGTTGTKFPVAAKGTKVLIQDGSSIYIHEPSGSSLGASLFTLPISSVAGGGGPGVWDYRGHVWFAVPGGLYEVDPDTGAYVFHDLPSADDTVAGQIAYDSTRGRIYICFVSSTYTNPVLWEYVGFDDMRADSGQWRQAVTGKVINAIYHDPVSDIVLLSNRTNKWVYRYRPGSWQQIDAVRVADTTPDETIDYDLSVGFTYYADNCAYVIARRSTNNYLIKIVYEGDVIGSAGGASQVSSALHALYEVENATTIHVHILRSTEPIVYADGEFSVHVDEDEGSGGGAPGSGTVVSVGLDVPAEFSVSGSPVTSSGTITMAKVSQDANLVYAGPTTGAAAAPSFRSLVVADIPVLTAAKLPTISTARFWGRTTAGTGAIEEIGVTANNGLLFASGFLSIDRAFQADMESPTTGHKVVFSTGMIYHPGVAKAHCRFAGSTGSIVGTAYNVSSITRHAAGDWTVNLSGSFPPSSVNNTITLTADHSAPAIMVVDTRSGVTAYRIKCYDTSGTLIDPAHVNFTLHGDL